MSKIYRIRHTYTGQYWKGAHRSSDTFEERFSPDGRAWTSMRALRVALTLLRQNAPEYYGRLCGECILEEYSAEPDIIRNIFDVVKPVR